MRRHWPALAAVALLWGATAALFLSAVRANDGQFAYILDDPYIHMAVARNLVERGVWGVTPYAFSSSTSSILWPLLLAGVYRLFGVGDLAPLALNLLIGTAVVLVIDRFLRQGTALRRSLRFLVLLFVVFAIPMPALMFSGMEHGLHTLVAIPFAVLAARQVARPNGATARTMAVLLLLAALLTAARYEGLFLVGVVALLLLARRRITLATAVVLAALLPLAVYGLVAVANGVAPVPYSVLLKGSWPAWTSLRDLLTTIGLYQLFQSPHIFFLIIASLITFIRRYDRQGLWEDWQVLSLIFFAIALLHTQFATIGWGSRYDGYLVALGLLIIGVTVLDEPLQRPIWRGDWPRRTAVLFLALALLFPFLSRAATTLLFVQPASGNIYQQQVQMGRFLHAHYTGQPVAANDIGAISYLADLRLLDIYGLGTTAVAEMRLAGVYGPEPLARLAAEEGVQIAIVYDEWLGSVVGGQPPGWQKVGWWTIGNNVAASSETVFFYAVDPDAAPILRRNLRQFAPQLPPGVDWRLLDEE